MTAPAPDSPPAITVDLIEDDDTLRDILTGWLTETDGFTFGRSFPDAETAIARMAHQPPDVALVDINLPGKSGIECVRALKLKLPQTQFMMLTVYDDSNHIFEALAAGATCYLLKRARREELVTALRDVHTGGSPMSSNIARKVVQSLQKPAAEPQSSPADKLSKREYEVLSLLAQGYLYKEIADSLGVSFQTVNTYVRRIYEKLHVHSRSQAVALIAKLPDELPPRS